MLTDAEEIKQGIGHALAEIQLVHDRLDAYKEGINAIGANMQWLVDNTQGLFQMFASPAFMQQIAQAAGVFGNGGQPGPEGPAEPAG